MKYVKNSETNSYAWVYTGGCFKDNKPVWYVDAVPGETYNFRDVQFEIREDQRDLENLSFENVDIANADEDRKSGTTGEENGEEEDEDETPEEAAARLKRESPKTRITRERKELMDKASNGEVKAEGFYLFYNIFMFISGLALFCAFVGFIALIVTIARLIQAARMPSGAPASGGYEEYPQDSYREDQRMIDGHGPATGPGGPNMGRGL